MNELVDLIHLVCYASSMGKFTDLEQPEPEEQPSAATERRRKLGPDNHQRIREYVIEFTGDPHYSTVIKEAVRAWAEASRMRGLDVIWSSVRNVRIMYGPVKGNAPNDITRHLDQLGYAYDIVSDDWTCDETACWHRDHHPGETWDPERKRWSGK